MFLRAAIIPVTNIGSKLAIPLVIVGIILSYYAQSFITVAYIGIVFSQSVVSVPVTLPVEFNASRRALLSIEGQGMLTAQELEGSRKVPSAAALDLRCGARGSLAQLLRLLLLVSGGRRS